MAELLLQLLIWLVGVGIVFFVALWILLGLFLLLDKGAERFERMMEKRWKH